MAGGKCQYLPDKTNLPLIAVCLGNKDRPVVCRQEVLDWMSGITAPNWQNGLFDIANTLLWPCLLTLAAAAGAFDGRGSVLPQAAAATT
jgi:hypothetical protein